jgi:hypothetical protein
MELLRLLCEGVGLCPDYFEGDLSAGDVVVNVNHYPPCPDPARTLGLPPHCDRNLITLLLRGASPATGSASSPSPAPSSSTSATSSSSTCLSVRPQFLFSFLSLRVPWAC